MMGAPHGVMVLVLVLVVTGKVSGLIH